LFTKRGDTFGLDQSNNQTVGELRTVISQLDKQKHEDRVKLTDRQTADIARDTEGGKACVS